MNHSIEIEMIWRWWLLAVRGFKEVFNSRLGFREEDASHQVTPWCEVFQPGSFVQWEPVTLCGRIWSSQAGFRNRTSGTQVIVLWFGQQPWNYEVKLNLRAVFHSLKKNAACEVRCPWRSFPCFQASTTLAVFACPSSREAFTVVEWIGTRLQSSIAENNASPFEPTWDWKA